MVVGESGLGKTTFVNTLFSTTIKNYSEHRLRHKKQMDKTVRVFVGSEKHQSLILLQVEIAITKAELEEKFFKGSY